MVSLCFENGGPATHRVMITAFLAAFAVCAVVFVQPGGDAAVAREELLMGGGENIQLAQQLHRYDSAIHKVDQGIARSKAQLVQQSRQLGEATKFAMAMHSKLSQDHQVLLTEKARSRAMKSIRSALAKKETLVMMERRKLQVDSLQLAQLEQKARKLLSPDYVPAQAELQVVAQESPAVPKTPPMFMMQKGDLANSIATKASGAGVEPALAHKIQASINEGLKN